MDQLKQGMSLRGYGQRDPIVEYRIEGFAMFDEMIATIREDAVHMLLTIEVRQQNQEPKREQVAKPTGEGAPAQAGAKGATPVRVTKIGRNDPCPAAAARNTRTVTARVYNRKNGPTMGYKEEKQHQARHALPAHGTHLGGKLLRAPQVRALIVKDKMIISDGYNGTPAGFENICEDETGKTKSYVLHAEANAITKVAKSANNCDGSTLYITAAPCIECSKLIIQAGIRRVVYSDDYRSEEDSTCCAGSASNAYRSNSKHRSESLRKRSAIIIALLFHRHFHIMGIVSSRISRSAARQSTISKQAGRRSVGIGQHPRNERRASTLQHPEQKWDVSDEITGHLPFKIQNDSE